MPRLHSITKLSKVILMCSALTATTGLSQYQIGADIEGEAAGDRFGKAVPLSADGNRLAIGAPFNDRNGNSAGQVRVYDWNGSAWIQAGAVIEGEAAGDRSGKAVALSADGNRLAIGEWGDDSKGSDTGNVRVFDWNGSAWVKVGSDIIGEAAGDRFIDISVFLTDLLANNG